MPPPYKIPCVGLLLLIVSIAARINGTHARVDECNGICVASMDQNVCDEDMTCTVAPDEADCWTQTGDQETSTVSNGKCTVGAVTKFSHGVIECVEIL